MARTATTTKERTKEKPERPKREIFGNFILFEFPDGTVDWQVRSGVWKGSMSASVYRKCTECHDCTAYTKKRGCRYTIPIDYEQKCLHKTVER